MMHDFTYQIININYISGGPSHARYIDVSCIKKLIIQIYSPYIQIEKTICLLVFDNIGNIIIGIVTLLNYYVYIFPHNNSLPQSLAGSDIKYFMPPFVDWKPYFHIFNQSLLLF